MEEPKETEKLNSPKQNGGARPGAGRKPKEEKFKVPIAKAEKKIADKLPMLVDKALELAEGVLIEDFNIVTMETSIYQKPPDLGAIKYLVDRIMGKPTERKEHSFPDKPLEEMSEDELRQIRDS
jgi:hypothetical protein